MGTFASPCPFLDTAPPDATSFTITWTRNGSITYDINDSVLNLYGAQKAVASAGGVVLAITFYDSAHNTIPTDGCGNPIVVSPPPPAGLSCPPGFVWDDATGDCVSIGPPVIHIPPIVVTPPPPSPPGGGTPPPPPPPTPPPTPTCPPGFHWDATIEMCVADPLPVIVPPPGGDDGDEFTDCCQETLLALEAIRAAIAALHGTVSGGGDASAGCCVKVVTAIGVVAQGLAAVAQAIIDKPTNVNVALDFTPLVDAVAALKASLDALSPAMSDDTEKLVTALDSIKQTLVGPPTTFRALPPDVDVDAMIQYEVDNYALDSGAAQLLTTPGLKTP